MKQIRFVAIITFDKNHQVQSIDVGVCDREKPTKEWLTRLFVIITDPIRCAFMHVQIDSLRDRAAAAGRLEDEDRAYDAHFDKLLDDEIKKAGGDDIGDPDDIPFQ